MTDDLLQTAFGSFHLQPLHHHPRSPLRAWNAADELLLREAEGLAQIKPSQRILLVNDSAGALGIALHAVHPHSWNDSFSAFLALRQNLARNNLPEDAALTIASHQSPQGPYDSVLIQLPKTLSLLEHQLNALRPHLHEETRVIGAGMVKHMTKSMQDLFEQQIGPSTTSLAEKKARLIFARFDPALTIKDTPPTQNTQYAIPGTSLQLVNHANVFSREKLDIGTRFLLEQFPDLSNAQTILDLGCGNGALGLFAAWRYPNATLHFTDDSFLAVQSAQASLTLNGLTNPAHFHCGDCLEQFEGQVDTILCNPPFHEGNKVHTEIAGRMFRGAAQHLNPGGQLHIVANRHLDYPALLKRHFRRVQVAASNAKFVILSASR